MPATVHRSLRRLTRRVALGVFLDTWPAWAAAGLVLAGLAALVCRLFVPAASARLPWLWLAPLLAVLPALIICYRRSYSSADVVALADSLSGGTGTLIALFETGDAAWGEAAPAADALARALPRLRPWRRIAVLVPATAFMAAAFWLPQRVPQRSDTLLANEIASRLDATVAELKQEQLITAAEEERLDEEIERIRRGAERRVDSSSWDAPRSAPRDRSAPAQRRARERVRGIRGAAGSRAVGCAASAAKRATRPERADEAASERA